MTDPQPNPVDVAEGRAREAVYAACDYCGVDRPAGHLFAPFTEQAGPWMVALQVALSAHERIAELEAERDEARMFLDNAVSRAPEPLRALGEYLGRLLDEDRWAEAERYLNAAVSSVSTLKDQVARLKGALENAWRDGWAECKGRLTDDEAFCLTEDVEQDAWLDSQTRAALNPARDDGGEG